MATKAPLEERLQQIQAEIEEAIAAHVTRVAAENPGVPAGSIRQMITAPYTCSCKAFASLRAKGEL